jgi:hypothetical protein
MAQQRDIQYVNKTFDDFRQQLIDYTKNYFPDTYNDFSPTSPGMLFMEMAAYVGDVLSFYQDIQLQETLLQYAQEPGNLYAMAYMMGYRPKITTPSVVDLEVYQRVPAILSGGDFTPNYDYALVLDSNIELQSTTGTPVRFLTQDRVNFGFSSSYDPTEVSVYATSGGSITEFLLKKKVKAISAEVRTATIDIASLEKFTTVTIEDDNIVGILAVSSSAGEWTEVPYLGQDTVFTEVANAGPDKNLTPYILQLKKVPRRFVTRFTSTGALQLQFGAGTSTVSDSTITPDPTNIGLGIPSQGVSMIDKAYDPSNFMYTGTYGVAPVGTIAVSYLVGGGVEANVPSDTITVITNNRNPTYYGVGGSGTTYLNSLAFNNPEAATGGKDGDTIEEIRQNSYRSFNEQLRAVTKEDYTVRALSLPSRFGSIAKVYVTQDQLTSTNSSTDNLIDSNPLALSMYVLSYDNEGKLIPATSTLKSNLQTYLNQYRLLTDAVNIRDAFVVNIAVKYDIVTLPSTPAREVLLSCTQVLKDYFKVTNWSINQPINISKLVTLLDRVKGVQTVQKIEIENKVGGLYSQYAYDIKGATRDNIVYPSYDPCIFEIKFPDSDIEGRITSL